jgi:hypothetical protein
MPPLSADVRKAEPLPLRRNLPGQLQGAQSIEIKYFHQGVFGEHIYRRPLPLVTCAAWVSNGKS